MKKMFLQILIIFLTLREMSLFVNEENHIYTTNAIDLAAQNQQYK